jgi:hypothetical protein
VIGGTYKTSVLYYTVMDLPALEELSGMDPASLQLAFKAALTLKRTIDTAKLKRQVKEIEDAVDLLGTRLDEALLIDLATAYDHLAASRRAANDDLRRAELNNARVSFNRLTRRPRTGPVAAGSEKLTHEQLVAIGHLGNFHYFLLSDDPRQALEQAYTCATMFPLLAIEMFPPEIFSRDYHAELRSITRRADERRAMALALHDRAMVDYRNERREYLREMAWKLPLAGGALLAGLVGATVSPPMAGRGLQWATGIMAGTGSKSVVPPGRPRLVIVDLEEPETNALMSRVSAEADQRHAVLQR